MTFRRSPRPRPMMPPMARILSLLLLLVSILATACAPADGEALTDIRTAEGAGHMTLVLCLYRDCHEFPDGSLVTGNAPYLPGGLDGILAWLEDHKPGILAMASTDRGTWVEVRFDLEFASLAEYNDRVRMLAGPRFEEWGMADATLLPEPPGEAGRWILFRQDARTAEACLSWATEGIFGDPAVFDPEPEEAEWPAGSPDDLLSISVLRARIGITELDAAPDLHDPETGQFLFRGFLPAESGPTGTEPATPSVTASPAPTGLPGPSGLPDPSGTPTPTPAPTHPQEPSLAADENPATGDRTTPLSIPAGLGLLSFGLAVFPAIRRRHNSQTHGWLFRSRRNA